MDVLIIIIIENTDLLIILLTRIQVHKSTFSIHKIILMISPGKHSSNTGIVRDNAHSPLHLGKITTRNNSWRLIVDTTFVALWTPIHKLNGSAGLNGAYCRVHILRHNITMIQQSTSHVISKSRITLNHYGRRIESTLGDLSNRFYLQIFLGTEFFAIPNVDLSKHWKMSFFPAKSNTFT